MHESLEFYAYQKIKNDIVSATLTPGVLLSENEISGKLGISRTPVHSAIIQLEKEGFLESLPKRGFIIKDISFTEFFDMHETIVAMEYYALSRIADSKALDMNELKKHLDAQTRAQETDDTYAYYEASFGFATSILSSTGNKAMLAVLGQYRDKMLCKVISYRKTLPDYKPKFSRNRNEKIYTTLLTNDLVEARSELLHTMMNVRDMLSTV